MTFPPQLLLWGWAFWRWLSRDPRPIPDPVPWKNRAYEGGRKPDAFRAFQSIKDEAKRPSGKGSIGLHIRKTKAEAKVESDLLLARMREGGPSDGETEAGKEKKAGREAKPESWISKLGFGVSPKPNQVAPESLPNTSSSADSMTKPPGTTSALPSPHTWPNTGSGVIKAGVADLPIAEDSLNGRALGLSPIGTEGQEDFASFPRAPVIISSSGNKPRQVTGGNSPTHSQQNRSLPGSTLASGDLDEAKSPGNVMQSSGSGFVGARSPPSTPPHTDMRQSRASAEGDDATRSTPTLNPNL
eukprot:gene14156-20120_t